MDQNHTSYMWKGQEYLTLVLQSFLQVLIWKELHCHCCYHNTRDRIKWNSNCYHKLQEVQYYKISVTVIVCVPVIFGHSIRICLPSVAPIQWGKLHVSSNPADMLSHSSFDEGVFIYGSFRELSMARVVSETIWQTVDFPIW